MDRDPAAIFHWLFDPRYGATDRLIPRWLFLRALGLIYFSAFFSLVFQIRGLIGPQGILPAGEYLQAVASSTGSLRYWFAPTLLWFSSGSHMLVGLCWAGMVTSVLLTFNVWPRATLLICFVCFLSFVSAAAEFSGYQSDGMLLEAGFLSLFFAPPGLHPGLGQASPPSRASLFLLQWEWFRIYFESGIVKLASGDPEWRHLTAIDEYYQNGPLPTWIGWYVQHLPHWFHAATVVVTLATELVLVWMIFLPRRWRVICFLLVTALQIGIILTANYTFLNYLVLALGFLLLDDRSLRPFVPHWLRRSLFIGREAESTEVETSVATAGADMQNGQSKDAPTTDTGGTSEDRSEVVRRLASLKLALSAVVLSLCFYVSTAQLIVMIFPQAPLPTAPVTLLDPFRIANRYGLFAVMTRGRYEIEFQGSNDGQTWVAYPFRYKPQDPKKRPGIYAPYQPRFDWNLWFASLGSWRDNSIVPATELHLLDGDPDVLALFAGNPFPQAPPRQVRAVLWQYWFTTMAERRAEGLWWHRRFLGLYAPTLENGPNGKINVLEWPKGASRQ